MSTAPRSRPITDQEYRNLTQQQRVQLGLDEPQQGAPIDFSGPVFPNPNHVQPRLDTDSGIEPTRLPNGVSFNHQNFQGSPQYDISKPDSAEILPPALQTVQAQFGGDKRVSTPTTNTETVTMRLPSGEEIDGVVPAGLSDDEVKSYVRMKRPDLFGAPAGIQSPANPMDQYTQEHSPAAGVAAMSGGTPNLRPASTAEGVLGGAGLGAAGLATYGPAVAGVTLPFLRTQAQKHPIIATMAAQQLIHEARQIPGVGRFIPSAAEWLPFLIPGMAGKGGPKPEPIEPAFPGAPEPTMPPEIQQSQPLGKVPPTGALPEAQSGEALANTPRPKLPFLPPQYPPEAPQTFAPPRTPSPAATDRLETRSIQEQIRDAAETEDQTRQRIIDQEWFARNAPSTTKGDLVQQARAGRAQPTVADEPVTPSAPAPSPESDEMVKMKKMLTAAQRMKRSVQ